MKIIGVTGGVGCGKSFVLSYLKQNYSCEVLLADQVANDLKNPGKRGYDPIVNLLGKDILNEDGTIDNKKMAQVIFSSPELLQKVNDILHPLVREEIMERIEVENVKGEKKYFFLEAALLIEEGYQEVVDEMWYIYAGEDVRMKRLSESRGYSEEKTMSIMSKQLSEEEFRKHSDFVIDNSFDEAETARQIDEYLTGK